jgi:flagellar biosynthetic protein FlhB
MAAGSDQEKTEPASARKREKSRQEGNVARSQEITSSAILVMALGVLYFSGGWLFARLSRLMGGIFGHLDDIRLTRPEDAVAFLSAMFQEMLVVMAPLMIGMLIAGVVANVGQIGFLLTGKTLTPNLKKINPVSGIKRLVSLKSLVEALKSILKTSLIGLLAFVILQKEMAQMPGLMQMAVGQLLVFVGEVAFKLAFFVCLAVVGLAILDLMFQRWHYEKDLRMTKQEVKDEIKQTQGDPQIKSRIRRAQREMAQRRMMAAVPHADVVITNPTHLAVALRYDTEQMMAPTVVAKGADHVAERIKAVALENGVPIVEEKPLARALFAAVEIDAHIPSDLYRAVAEILAYVYRLKGMTSPT